MRSLDDIDNIEADLAIVPDFHVSFAEYPFRGYMLSEMYHLFGQDVSHVVDYFNSGVIYAKDTEMVHRFFEQWNENWTYSAIEKNNPKDQPALLKTDADAGQVIRVLDGKYNCQIAASIRYLYSAKILHFLTLVSLLTIISIHSTVLISTCECVMKALLMKSMR